LFHKTWLGAIDLVNRRIRIKRNSTKSNAGARFVELNQTALGAVIKLYRRAELLGASDPEHYLLPADLSKHTKSFDPLAGGRGYDVTPTPMFLGYCVEKSFVRLRVSAK
jgi:hypothetical protein